MRAKAITSPFGGVLSVLAARVDACMGTLDSATASLAETAFSVTSTICARPASSRCVKRSVFSGISPILTFRCDKRHKLASCTRHL